MAAADWATDLFQSDHHWIRQICRDPDSRLQAALFSQQVPNELFSSTRTMDFSQDQAIVCEGIAGGAEMLLTSNVNTIDHVQLNNWLVDSGYRDRQFIHSPDFGLTELVGQSKAELAHVVAITMCLSYSERDPFDEHISLLQFADGLRSSFPNFRSVIRHEELRSNKASERWNQARANLEKDEWREIRKLESQRISRTTQAAREAGFGLER